MADSSFDIVSKVDHQEVDNALNQAAKEVATRFDFKNTSTTIAWRGEDGIEITSSTEERCKAALDVLKDKLVKRQVSLKALDAGVVCSGPGAPGTIVGLRRVARVAKGSRL